MNIAGRFEGPAEFNVLGEALQPCSTDPLTGFFRTGYCAAGPDNAARHLVCIEITAAFLEGIPRASRPSGATAQLT